MTGYTFVYGVDGFGADVAPAYEEGVYLDFNKAFKKFMELTKPLMREHPLYEDGYGEDYFPDEDKKLKSYYEHDDVENFEKELSKHIIKDVKEYCTRLFREYDNPPIGQYLLVEVEIIK